MTDIKYKSAPVSEVIFGVTFKDGLLSRNNFYLKFISKLIDQYPGHTIHAPLVNEELIGYQNNLIANPQISGPVLYRLRSTDTSWLLQIQWNKFYLNWVRDDQKDVGEYPGYSTIFSKFKTFLNEIMTNTGGTYNDIQYYELTYHDRIRWSDYVTSINDVDKMVNDKLPQFNVESAGIEIVNFNKNLSAKVENLGGFMTFNFLTATEVTGKQILKLELSIRGNITTLGELEWFDKAHTLQVDLFEKFLNPQILEKWRQ